MMGPYVGGSNRPKQCQAQKQSYITPQMYKNVNSSASKIAYRAVVELFR